MVAAVRSVGLQGLDGFMVSVECFLSMGLPSFELVGLPDAAVRESRERVRAALKNCNFEFPVRRIAVNLAPADIRKEGPLYDLPILLGLLAASNQIEALPPDAVFVGELSLEGRLRPVSGMLPMVMAAAASGAKSIFVPEENSREASLVEGITVYPVRHARQLLLHLNGESELDPAPPYIHEEQDLQVPDFSEVYGQENVKRSLMVAAAGGHNVMLMGPPGAGKSMLARRLPSILPQMLKSEMLCSTSIHSVLGLTGKDDPLLRTRPFRSPHHSVSSAGLVGGGRIPRPGEMSLAHNGVLFLDELPEFNRDALESLRQPMEDGCVTITRVGGTMTYPARFMLVCAMNPCRCGWFGHSSGRCRCSAESVRSYFGKVSGPILDRMDIMVEVPSVSYEDLRSDTAPRQSSESIRTKVVAARKRQTDRFGVPNALLNSEQIHSACKLDDACDRLMKNAFDRLNLTARAYTRILRVSRTIADLAESEDIGPRHLAEALQYRQNELLSALNQ